MMRNTSWIIIFVAYIHPYIWHYNKLSELREFVFFLANSFVLCLIQFIQYTIQPKILSQTHTIWINFISAGKLIYSIIIFWSCSLWSLFEWSDQKCQVRGIDCKISHIYSNLQNSLFIHPQMVQLHQL